MAELKQSQTIQPDRQALAPYNFVPLPEKVILLGFDHLPDQDEYHKTLLSGHIDCKLTTASPIYTRGLVPPEEFTPLGGGKNRPEFFYINSENEPELPGSSLRGLIRGLVEIASFSKVSWVSNSRLIYRAVGDTTTHGTRYRDRLMRDDGNKQYTPLMRGGYMHRRGSDWVIQPARVIDGTTFAVIKIDDGFFSKLRTIANTKNCREIFIQVGPYEYQEIRGGFIKVRQARVRHALASPAAGHIQGAWVKSGPMASKRNEPVIYPEDPEARALKLSDELIDAYRDQISGEQKNLLGDNGVLAEGHPVFYSLDKDDRVEAIGHCRMLRIPYPFTPLEFVPPRKRKEEDLDIAEAIFGFTRQLKQKEAELKKRAYAGRVFFSNARLEKGQKDLWLAPQKTITPRILGGPKPTTFQHYLIQTQPDRYMVGRTRDNQPKFELRLTDYTGAGETLLRGSKQYWHKGDVPLSQLEWTRSQVSRRETDNDKIQTQIQPLRSGLTFQFRIDFENLYSPELGALLWVLQTAADPSYRLKFGMGKPYGMGAVAIQPTLYLGNRKQRYSTLFEDGAFAFVESPDEKMAGKAVADFERFVLQALGSARERNLADLERIGELLALLSWPGPAPEQTRYLEITHIQPDGRRVNEYRERPVLPQASTVLKSAPAAQVRQTPVVNRPPEQSKTVPPGYYRGTVKVFGLGNNQDYGFIRYLNASGQEIEVYVNRRGLKQGLAGLEKGQRVIFTIRAGMRGDQAYDVSIEN